MSLKKTTLNGLTILSLTLLASTAGWSSRPLEAVGENGASASKAKLTTPMEKAERLSAGELQKDLECDIDLLGTGSKAAEAKKEEAATAKEKKAAAPKKQQVQAELVQKESMVAVMRRIDLASDRDPGVLASLTACGYAPSRDELVAQAVGMLQ